MSNSAKKMDVVVVKHPQWDKDWVKVTLKNGRTFYPSFEDLYRIVKAICHCEEKKYPYGKGAKMVGEFLWYACFPSVTYERLAQYYKLPLRKGDKVINPNGAKLQGGK